MVTSSSGFEKYENNRNTIYQFENAGFQIPKSIATLFYFFHNIEISEPASFLERPI